MHNDVRELRAARGLSQGDLAQEMHVSRQTINAVETGRYTPSLPLAIALARFFQRPVEEVFHAPRQRVAGVLYNRWFLPAFSLFLGVVIGAAQWKGGDPQTGLLIARRSSS